MKKQSTRIAQRILANAGIILGGVYILFYILDRFNPMLHFLSGSNPFSQYLDIILAVMAMLLGILYLAETWKRVNKAIRKKREEKDLE